MLKRLKQTMASDPRGLQEFCSDPHAVAGACPEEPREEGLPPRSLPLNGLKCSHDSLAEGLIICRGDTSGDIGVLKVGPMMRTYIFLGPGPPAFGIFSKRPMAQRNDQI